MAKRWCFRNTKREKERVEIKNNLKCKLNQEIFLNTTYHRPAAELHNEKEEARKREQLLAFFLHSNQQAGKVHTVPRNYSPYSQNAVHPFQGVFENLYSITASRTKSSPGSPAIKVEAVSSRRGGGGGSPPKGHTNTRANAGTETFILSGNESRISLQFANKVNNKFLRLWTPGGVRINCKIMERRREEELNCCF